MSSAVASPTLTGEEIVALCRRHTIFEWSVQTKVDPIPVDRAEGVYFWTPEGKRYLDFNSQLMCTNIGHSHPRVVKAIQEQAAKLCYANPFMATEPRARLGKKLAEITPGDIDTFFFTNGGAEANENAIRIARVVTGRHKILVRYRSYHGGTAGRHRPDRRSAPLGLRAEHPRRRAHPRLPQVGQEGPRARGRQPPRHRGGHPLRGRAERGRDHRGDGRGHERHPGPAGRLHAGPAPDLRQARDHAHRRRGHVGLRAHGQDGSPSTTGASCPTSSPWPRA